MTQASPIIAILGASGLIGHAIALQLPQQGYSILPIARTFSAAQKAGLGPKRMEQPILQLETKALAHLLSEQRVDIVVNCLGILQDSVLGRTDEVHRAFVARLLQAIEAQAKPVLLIHLSISGTGEEDQTAFSRSKREAERMITAGSHPFAILRPGFVAGPAAYGGSALVRALAASPFDLPQTDMARPFAVTDMDDIIRTILFLARRWAEGEQNWSVTWDIMERKPAALGHVIAAFRQWLGNSQRGLPLPAPLVHLAARLGDIVACLGWTPPARSTALQELRRGVQGDPTSWIMATGIEPSPLEDILRRLQATVQEQWFARLFLLKAVILGVLTVFWVASGLIVLTLVFAQASHILLSHGFPPWLAESFTALSSLTDTGVGLAIAFRRTCRAGLLLGVGVSLFYLISAALLTPDIWLEPLGALVKTVPAIVLMVVALGILEKR